MLARCIADPQFTRRPRHAVADVIRFHMLLIAAGYPDANEL